jgi:hypothetical protein
MFDKKFKEIKTFEEKKELHDTLKELRLKHD